MNLEKKFEILLKNVKDIATYPCDNPKIDFVDGKLEIMRCNVIRPNNPYCASCVARAMLIQIEEK